MRKQQTGISRKIMLVITAVILFITIGFPVEAAKNDKSVYEAVFDSAYYLEHNPDLQAAIGDNSNSLFNHFLTSGMAEGRQGNEEFNVRYYKEKYPDLQAAFGEDLPSYYLHYATIGKAEGRIGNGTVTKAPAPAPANNKPMETNIDINPSDENNLEFAYEVVELVNKVREENGLGKLSTTPELMKTSLVRAKEIVTLMSHTRPDGTPCVTAFDQNGVKHNWAGENIAGGQDTPAEVMEGWMNSPGHRANILRAEFGHIGVGCYQTNGKYGIYWTQCFTD